MPFKYDITGLKTKQSVCSFLAIEEADLDSVISFNSANITYDQGDDAEIFSAASRMFRHHEIPKKNRGRGVRVVWEPTLLMTAYKALSRKISMIAKAHLTGFPHPYCYGYVGGRNIKENAARHCGNRNLICVDLEDFFPTIGTERIRRLFGDLGFPDLSADWLSRFVTIDGRLPLGFPTSPTIANAVCLPMDVKFQMLAEVNGCVFSRYADDISFSGNGALPNIEEIASIVRQNGFSVVTSKTRKSKIGQAHYVTGLSVTDPAQPHVPRAKKHRLRQELYYAKKFGLDNHCHRHGIYDLDMIQREVNRLDGWVKFIAFHEPHLSSRLKSDWQEILINNESEPSFTPRAHAKLPFSINVDEAEFKKPNGNRVLALAMTVSQHEDRVREGTLEVYDEYFADPYAAGNRGAIKNKGLHYADAHPDLRLDDIRKLQSLPFEGYVAFMEMSKTDEYQAVYLRLLNVMLKRRIMAAEGKFAKFVFEKNDKVSQEAVRSAVIGQFKKLQKAGNRHPKDCFVEFSGKPDLGLSVPDFLLGALGGFLKMNQELPRDPLARERVLFERIRDKYRLILDIDGWIEYGRRRPIRPWYEDVVNPDDASAG